MRKKFLTAAVSLSIRPLRLLAALLVTAAFAAPLSAQSSSSMSGYTPSGAAPGSPAGSYPMSGFDTVNPYNGGLNFSLPLMQIGGRGSAGYTMRLKIEQRWTLSHYVEEYPEQNQRWDLLVPEYNWWTGLEPGYGPGVLQGRQVGNGLMVCTSDSPHYSTFHQTLTRLTFTAPDGTEFELRDRATDGQPALVPNCARYLTPPSRGKVFVAADGSSATFVSDDVIYDNIVYSGNIYPSGYLMLKDGTRYRIDGGGVSWIRDRNGNKVTFGGGGAFVTDSLNRQVTIDYNVTDAAPYGLCDRITRKGFGDASRTVRVSKAPLGSALRAGYSLQSYTSLFPDALSTSSTQHNPTVTSAVWLPDGRSYKFFYNSYGELARVELPTGGAIEYDWAAGATGGPASGVNEVGSNAQWIYRRIVERRTYANGTALEAKMTYSRPESRTGVHTYSNLGYVDVSQLDAVGALLAKTRHYYHGSPTQSLFGGQDPIYHTPWKEGREWQTEALAADGATVLRRAVHTWQQPAAGGTWPLTQAEANDGVQTNDPQITLTVTTLEPSGANLVSAQVFAYDQYSNRTDVWEHDFGAGSAGPLVRRTQTAYVTTNNGVNYTALNPSAAAPDVNSTYHLRGLPLRQSVYDAAGAERSRTVYEYDNYNTDANHAGLVGRAGIVGLCDAAAVVNSQVQCVLSNPTGYTARGNVTAVTSYADAAALTGAVTIYSMYDVAGNVVVVKDARGNTSAVSYTDVFSDGVGRNTYAFPTGMTSAVPAPNPGPYAGRGSDTPLTSSTVYDYWTGLVRSSTDANNRTTTYEYNDPFDRLRTVNRPDGGWTQYNYGSNSCGDWVGTYSSINAAQSTESYLFFDRLGRPSRSFKLQNTAADWITMDTQYDALGRAWRTSKPYHSGGCGSPVNPSGRWTENTFDALGRPTHVRTADNAQVVTSYVANTVTVTDQAGKQRKSVSDALGRLIAVTEAPNDPNYNHLTTYSYDSLGNLRKVNQGGQLRYFMYDSLGRLIRARNPEQKVNEELALTDNYKAPDDPTPNVQWTLGYSYDANSNLSQRTDARNVTTTYTYDNLDRLIRTDYSDLTPFTLNTYDFATNGRGRFHANYESSTEGTINYVFAYDAMGRPTTGQTSFYLLGTGWLPGYSYARAYNKAGNVTSQTYPSGRTVSYNYDVAGRLADSGAHVAFSGNLGDGVHRTYAAGVSYDEAGRVLEERFGTQTPLYHKRAYNVRGQLYDVRLSSVPRSADPLNWNRGALLNYYTQQGGWTPGGSGTDNNGNVKLAQHWVPDGQGGYNWMNQYYEYDPLNRLSYVKEQQNGTGAYTGEQHYTYDRWGNRRINAADTSGYLIPEPQFELNPPQATQEVAEPSNRLYAPGDAARAPSQKLMRYDQAGNLVHDESFPGGGGRTYDAENRMTSAWGYSTLVGGPFQNRYVYDAGGKRVRRKVDMGEVWQVYGFDGELLAEYAVVAAPSQPQKEYGYRAGKLLVAAQPGGQVRWLVTDHLGTPRMTADLSGSLAGIRRHDYLPFGEEIGADVGGRTTQQGYSVADGVRQKFAGSERDTGTALDFMQARYYGNSQGRFTSADPLLASAVTTYPQTWNRYSYALNNPLRFVDPTGLMACPPDRKCIDEGTPNEHYVDEKGDVVLTFDPGPNGVDASQSSDTPVLGLQGRLPSQSARAAAATVGAVGGGTAAAGAGAGTVIILFFHRLAHPTPWSPYVTLPDGRRAISSTAGNQAYQQLKPVTPGSVFTESRDRNRLTVYHYTTAGPEQFVNGLHVGSSATDYPGWTAESASAGLGIPPPTLVYPVTIDPQQTPFTMDVVQPNRYGLGGLTEYYFPIGTPPGSVGPPRKVPSYKP